MSAPRGYEHKTGEGRARTKPPAVPSVETLPCPESHTARIGTHVMTAVDWQDAPDWGGRVHVASNGSDVPDRHDATEAEAEGTRG